MTVESTARKQSFAGGQSALAFTFRALTSAPSDIKVVTVTSGTESLLTYTTDYTATISTDGVGGTVHVIPSYSTAYTYTVYRETTDLQESDYDDYNQFPADTLETDLDRRCMIDQEQSDLLNRTLRMPVSSSVSGSSLELPAPSSGFGIVWNTAGTGMINTTVPVGDIVTEAQNYATSSATSATESANYATSSSTSATESANSATTASTSATEAGNYATSASTSATEAANSATTSSTSAAEAVLSATTASTQAAAAALSATTASTQAAAAVLSATTASTQATAAGLSATTASTQAALAGNYATSASTSATAAALSATTASTQATLAGNYATTASTAAATIPDPTGQTVADQIRVNAAQDAYELFTPSAAGGATLYFRDGLGGNDYTIDDFIQDGAFHDLDLSAIVGTQSCLVMFNAHYKHGSADMQFYLRKNGFSDGNYAVTHFIQPVANTNHMNNSFVMTDTAGICEYQCMVSSGSWTTINLTVMAWITV